MSRHALRASSTAGHVMLGGVADDRKRWTHWVPIGAETGRYQYGTAWVATCGALCVPAGSDYLADLQACPQCDEREPGFSHRALPQCCVDDGAAT